MTNTRKPIVALLATPETSTLVLYGLYDVLLSAGAVYPDMIAGTPGEGLLDVRIVAADKTPFRCIGNIMVEPHDSVATLASADVVILCDIYFPIDTPPKGLYPAEIAWLRKMHADGTLICSVCTGSLVLAESGLLNGKRCAGHWAYRELFRSAYPEVEFVGDTILCVETAPEGIVTAASATAWQDLALYVIARLCGPEHAIRTAKVYLLASHDDGHLPFAAMTRRVQKDDRAIAQCQEWIADNYAYPNPVSAMVEMTGLNRRTFMRRFRAATGYLPLDYVHQLRIEEAKQIIERQPDSLDDVGTTVGYDDPGFFRRLFKRQTGLTPAAYRRKFAPILRLAEGPRRTDAHAGDSRAWRLQTDLANPVVDDPSIVAS
jgi:transcriptional regulator GlxA family with amidase domain